VMGNLEGHLNIGEIPSRELIFLLVLVSCEHFVILHAQQKYVFFGSKFSSTPRFGDIHGYCFIPAPSQFRMHIRFGQSQTL
jgi:hypothetical protein